MGKWELIIALTIFAVNGVLGYLAKREKEKAKRQAEIEAAETAPPPPPKPEPATATGTRAEVRVDRRPQATSGRRTVPVAKAPTAAPRSPRPPAPPRVPATTTGKTRFGTKPKPKPPAKAPAKTQPKHQTKPTSAQAATRSPTQSVKPAVAAPSPDASPADRWRVRVGDPRSLRSALIWSEVLGRPRGLDPHGPFDRE